MNPTDPKMNGSGCVAQNPDRATEVTSRIIDDSGAGNPGPSSRVPRSAASGAAVLLGESEGETQQVRTRREVYGDKRSGDKRSH